MNVVTVGLMLSLSKHGGLVTELVYLEKLEASKHNKKTPA
jgi:hypothetical protein